MCVASSTKAREKALISRRPRSKTASRRHRRRSFHCLCRSRCAIDQADLQFASSRFADQSTPLPPPPSLHPNALRLLEDGDAGRRCFGGSDARRRRRRRFPPGGGSPVVGGRRRRRRPRCASSSKFTPPKERGVTHGTKRSLLDGTRERERERVPPWRSIYGNDAGGGGASSQSVSKSSRVPEKERQRRM